jgi:ribosomal protein S18 acetylase RimI-like enzyme
MENPRIRRYQPDDAPAVWQLHNRALHEVGAHGGNGPWDDDLHHVEEVYLRGGEFLVAEVEGQVVGMGALHRVSSEQAEVKRMRVDPDHQRKGLGRAILAALEKRAKELGCRSLVLDTTTRQVGAQKLYESFGYGRTGTREYRNGPILFTLILYRKDL